MELSAAYLADILQTGPEARRYLLAFSGGLDSTVLLHLLADLKPDLTGLVAVHVDHGLQADSARWAAHCHAVCAGLGVECVVETVALEAGPGESMEAAARDARYAALEAHMDAGTVLLTAQHVDDQLETFLLQALRGAGVAGLAAMPRQAPFGPGHLLRPLLDVPRAALESWARTHALRWVEDPTNADPEIARSYLRTHVLPTLQRRWPAAAATVARSARHCAEASELLDELGAADIDDVLRVPAGGLHIERLQQYSAPRARNLVRYWLRTLGLAAPSARKLDQIFTSLIPASPSANPCVDWPGVEVRRYRGILHAMTPLPALDAGACLGLDPGRALTLPDGSEIRLVEAERGLDAARLAGRRLEIRYRQGGEQIRGTGEDIHHTLKSRLQEAGVVPWMRMRIPLLYVDDELAAVADIRVAAEFASAQTGTALKLEWSAHPPLF